MFWYVDIWCHVACLHRYTVTWSDLKSLSLFPQTRLHVCVSYSSPGNRLNRVDWSRKIKQPEDCEGRYQVESKEYSWPVKKMDFLKSDFYYFFSFSFFYFKRQLRSVLVFLILKVWGLARENKGWKWKQLRPKSTSGSVTPTSCRSKRKRWATDNL